MIDERRKDIDYDSTNMSLEAREQTFSIPKEQFM